MGSNFSTIYDGTEHRKHFKKPPPEINFNVLFIGDKSTGKSSMIYKYTDKMELLKNPSLCTTNIHKKYLHIPTKTHNNVMLSMIDTMTYNNNDTTNFTDINKFNDIINNPNNKINLVVFVYDAMDDNGLDNLKNKYNEHVLNCSNIPMILLANKCDNDVILKEANNGDMFSGIHNMCYMKNSINDEELFNEFKIKFYNIVANILQK